jgi:hypothetical protein
VLYEQLSRLLPVLMRANCGKTLSKCARVTRRTIRDVDPELSGAGVRPVEHAPGFVGQHAADRIRDRASGRRVVVLGSVIEQFVDE